MTLEDESNWQRYSIPGLLSWDIFRTWQLHAEFKNGSGQVSQQIGETGGRVFLSFGPSETVEDFTLRISDMLTKVTVRSSTDVVIGGRPARRVELIAHHQAIGVYHRNARHGPIHEQLTAVREHVVVISLKHQELPVLIGYRLREEDLPRYEQALERIVGSIGPDDGLRPSHHPESQ